MQPASSEQKPGPLPTALRGTGRLHDAALKFSIPEGERPRSMEPATPSDALSTAGCQLGPRSSSSLAHLVPGSQTDAFLMTLKWILYEPYSQLADQLSLRNTSKSLTSHRPHSRHCPSLQRLTPESPEQPSVLSPATVHFHPLSTLQPEPSSCCLSPAYTLQLTPSSSSPSRTHGLQPLPVARKALHPLAVPTSGVTPSPPPPGALASFLSL